MKHKKLWDVSAATTVLLSTVSLVSAPKSVMAAKTTSNMKRVQVQYLKGTGLPVYTNYNNGKYAGFKAQNHSYWNVASERVDKKGQLWYEIGRNEWIQARYTLLVEVPATKSAKSKKKHTKKIKTTVKKTSVKAKAKVKTKTNKKTSSVQMKTLSVSVPKKKEATTQVQTVANQASSTVSSVITLAASEVGKSYVWGATGPESFDCSGLVQYVFKQAAGVSLPRVTYDQVKVGQEVNMKSLKPGDLLFWGSKTAPYHVGIYIGNNQYIAAATPKEGVVLQTLSQYFYPSIAKRVL
ncbi:MAG: C40 family peptidase [Lactobacillus sp.]|nr:C40 family peptidase [Lactobacillus sp.]